MVLLKKTISLEKRDSGDWARKYSMGLGGRGRSDSTAEVEGRTEI